MTDKTPAFLKAHFPPGHPVCNHLMVKKTIDFARRWVLPTVKEHAQGKSILSAGCGFGTDVMTLVEAGFDAYGFDPAIHLFIEYGLQEYAVNAGVDAGAVEECIQNRIRMSPIADSDMFDKEFDLILAFECIEHVGLGDSPDRQEITDPFRKLWLTGLLRYLRPGGSMIITTPNRLCPVDEHGRHGLPIRFHSTRKDFTLSARELLNYFPSGVDITMLDPHDFFSFSNLPSICKPVVAKFFSMLHQSSLLHTPLCPHLFLLITLPDDFYPAKELPIESLNEFLSRHS